MWGGGGGCNLTCSGGSFLIWPGYKTLLVYVFVGACMCFVPEVTKRNTYVHSYTHSFLWPWLGNNM